MKRYLNLLLKAGLFLTLLFAILFVQQVKASKIFSNWHAAGRSHAPIMAMPIRSGVNLSMAGPHMMAVLSLTALIILAIPRRER